jgi:hypothetical protein
VIRLLALAAIVALPMGAAAQRRPYLQSGTDRSMTIVWQSVVPEPNTVCYGPRPDALTMRAGAGAGTNHTVRVEGLSADTRYYYATGHASCSPATRGDPSHYFRTNPIATRPFRFWVVGDSGTGGSMQARVRDAMFAAAGPRRPDLYLHVGDMAYDDGTSAQFTNNFFRMYERVLRNTVCWPAQGNHEGHSATSATETGPYYDAYVLPRAGEAGGLPSGTESYYSFDYANVHFIVLDSDQSGRDAGDPMIRWLEMDLAATDAEWVISYWHHPPYTHGSHDSDTEGDLRDMREVATRVLEEAGADVNFTGHSHIYERSYLVRGAYDTPTTAEGHLVDMGDGRIDGDGAYRANGDGTLYVVAGHGGTDPEGDADHPLMYFSEVANGSVLADVDGGSLTIRNIRYDGMETDRVSLVKANRLFLSGPSTGDVFAPGSVIDVHWVSTGETANVRLEYSLDGTTFRSIVESTENDGRYTWTAPVARTSAAFIRITDLENPTITDTNGPFELGERSAPVELISFGATWEYLDDGTDPGADWSTSAGGWSSGAGELGYGDGDEATELADEDPNVPSALFRTSVTVDDPVVSARLRILLDDAAAVYVNGVEVFAHNIGDRAVSAYAADTSADNEIHMAELDLASSNPFVVGENAIAVMVKQSGEDSSDLSFDFELVVTTQAPIPDAGPGSEDGGSTRRDGGETADPDGSPGVTTGGCACTAVAPSVPFPIAIALVVLARRRSR